MSRNLLIRVSPIAAIGLLVVLTWPHSLSSQRACCQGDWWLRWNHDSRETYVYGYTLGFSKGHLDGCEQAVKMFAAAPGTPGDKSPLQKCISSEPDFSKGSDYFVRSVTEFYERYPEDRDLYLNELIDHFAAGQSLEQIHKYPFWRHRRTSP